MIIDMKESLETIWEKLEEYRELKDLPVAEDEKEWAAICEAMEDIAALVKANEWVKVKV